MCAIALVASMTVAISTVSAVSQTNPIKTMPGKVVQIGYYSFLRSDCSGGAKPDVQVPTPPQHGQLIVKPATLTTKRLGQCGAVKAPTDVVLYKASADFVGTDPVAFDVVNTDTGQTQHVTVLVIVEADPL